MRAISPGAVKPQFVADDKASQISTLILSIGQWQREVAGIDRRSFLRLVGGGAIGAAALATFDVERLLWVPNQTMALASGNRFVSPDWIVREALRVLENHLTFTKAFNSNYDLSGFGSIGDTIRVRDSRRFAHLAYK